jgi:intergrase/recombinase
MLTHIRAAQSTSLDMRRTGFAVARAIREATDDKELVPKVLRKSFATIAVWEVGMPPEVVESFMGRKISTLGSTTARHYLGKAHADRLRPWAVKVDEALRAHRLGTPAAED